MATPTEASSLALPHTIWALLDGLFLSLLLLSCPARAADPVARSWTPEPKELSTAMTDADPFTYEILCPGEQHDPCDFGLEWKSPQVVGEVVVDYVTLGWLAYQPAVSGQRLEYWDGSAWQQLDASLEVDYTRQGEFAPLRGCGTVRWTYRFAAVTTTRIRIYVTRPQNPDPGFRVSAVRRFSAGERHKGSRGTGIHIVGGLPTVPQWLGPDANLAVRGAGADIVPGDPAEVRWPRRLLVNSLRTEPGIGVSSVEWWDGAGWRLVDSLDSSRHGEARFLPVSTTRLRLKGTRPVHRLEARLDSEAERYFREVQESRVDLLGMRFRSQSRPDLLAMQGLLLPMDYAKTAIGLPADLYETIVLSSGAFLMVEPDAAHSGFQKYDRWFAPAAGLEKELFGSELMRIDRRYVDGYLPAVVTTYTHKGFLFEERLHVTVPGDEPYGTVAEVTVTNRSHTPGSTAFTLAMGRHLNSWQANFSPKPTPLLFDALPTGYTIASDHKTVLSPAGDVILYAQQPGVWEGTPRENHLRYTLALEANKSRTLRFFVPNIERPFRDVDSLRRFDWTASFPRFRKWWNKLLSSGMTIGLPEERLNQIYRNLLAQALIITLDGEKVRYGAYQYETYFGIEEGWPAVALAQYGYPQLAQTCASFILSSENMDKENAHHQYRNGLAPWYAITIFRLTQDRAWLEKVLPAIESAAEWTVKVTNENKDPKFGGILPRYQYGGDIGTQAYSFYSSATCWRGLNYTAWVFGTLGRMEQARRYQQEAERFRRRLWEVADQVADRRNKPVFLPMGFDIGTRPDYREREPSYDFLGFNTSSSNSWQYLGNYWNLFAPMLLEQNLFECGDERAAWIPSYMEARGGVLAGLARFLLGVDHVYGKGYYQSLLEQGHRDRFLTSLYGVFAHGMSQNLYSSPEVAGVFPLRVSNAAAWREYMRTLWHWYFMWDYGSEGWQNYEGEPLSAGAGLALQLLRMALVRETVESSPEDTLRLLDGAPAHWFEPGKKISVRNASTFFGKVSFETEGANGSIRARVVHSPAFSARHVILRLPSPSGAPLRSVAIDGKPWADFSGDEIRLPPSDRIEVVATF